MSEKLKQSCLTAMFMALVCIATLFFKVSIPGGYAHLGNGFILLGCVWMGNPEALLIGGVASAMADFLGGYGQWIFPTLIIKGIMGFAIALIANGTGKYTAGGIYRLRTAIASAAGIAIMVAGYFLFGIWLMGSAAASLTQIPGLVSEGVVGIVVFYVLGIAFEKAHVTKLLTAQK